MVAPPSVSRDQISADASDSASEMKTVDDAESMASGVPRAPKGLPLDVVLKITDIKVGERHIDTVPVARGVGCRPVSYSAFTIIAGSAVMFQCHRDTSPRAR